MICNINFARPLLRAAKEAGKWVATDVHALSDLDDAYNQDYMQAADILFLSDESLPEPPEAILPQLMDRYSAEIVVIGLGAEGAAMGVRSDTHLEWFPAVQTRPVVNTIGAGDALFPLSLTIMCERTIPMPRFELRLCLRPTRLGKKGPRRVS